MRASIAHGLIATIALATATTAFGEGRSAVRRDVEGYAVATCLVQQKSDYLRRQGDGWGSIIINRGHGELDDWQPLRAAVKAEVKRIPMAIVHGDGPASDFEAPVFYCAEIIDIPVVRQAIEVTIKKMTPDYRRAKPD